MKSILQTFCALLFAAVVPAVVVTFLFSVASPSSHGAGIAFLIAFAFTAAHALILGGPLLLLGILLHAVRWWSCILAAFFIGFIPSALASGPSFLDAWPMGLLGAIGGFVFWLLWHVWVRRMPLRTTLLPAEPPVPRNGAQNP